MPRGKADGTKSALGPLVTIGKCEVEEKMVTSDFTHRGFVNLALLALNFYCRHNLSPLCERRVFCMIRRENITNGCFKNVATFVKQTEIRHHMVVTLIPKMYAAY